MEHEQSTQGKGRRPLYQKYLAVCLILYLVHSVGFSGDASNVASTSPGGQDRVEQGASPRSLVIKELGLSDENVAREVAQMLERATQQYRAGERVRYNATKANNSELVSLIQEKTGGRFSEAAAVDLLDNLSAGDPHDKQVAQGRSNLREVMEEAARRVRSAERSISEYEAKK
ncbi:MAG: hypothetical protein KDD44_10760, partial [Bdellovibrionales bacterium]|nr:hypothetical protein [Bdellovibrionales bacterium]